MLRTAILSAAAATLLVTGCGPSIAQHDGYKNASYKPWEKPKSLEFDEDNEVEVDDWVDYAERKRARWYAAELPGDGELGIQMKVFAVGEDDQEPDEDDEFDLAFEVLDADYRVIATANRDDDDAGDRTKQRTLYELSRGKYYLHVYAQSRVGKAEYTLELKYKRGSIELESDFPRDVEFPPALALIPAFDDAPAVAEVVPKKTPKKNTRRSPKKTPKEPKEPKTTDDKPAAGAMSGRIVNLSAAGGGTRITINRGSSKGVAVGWKGAVTNSKGQAIADGNFSIDKVTASESYATVGASRDAVEAAKRVYIHP